MGQTMNNYRYEKLKQEFEMSLGASLRDSRYLGNGLWQITALNGNAMSIDYKMARELLSDFPNSYGSYVFPTQMNVYQNAYDRYTTSYETVSQRYYDNYKNSVQYYPLPADFSRSTYQNISAQTYTNNAIKDKSFKLRKLYWNMYSRLGKDPLKEISC